MPIIDPPLDTCPPPESMFASDNYAGAHPRVLEALAAVNHGHMPSYGADEVSSRTTELFREMLGGPVDVCYVYGGTGANLVALQAGLRPWQGVICAATGHIAVDECGAPEHVGIKLLEVHTPDGKVTVDHLHAHAQVLGTVHHTQPGMVSITQPTELGTLYTSDEIGALVEVAHGYGMKVHVDGARLANAAAVLGDVAGFTSRVGVDLISFGGTKNGMVFGEAVVICTPDLTEAARFLQKQSTQLPSKVRFVSAQFEAMITDGLWLELAAAANRAAAALAGGADSVGITQSRVQVVNSVWPVLSPDVAAQLQAWSPFYAWDLSAGEYRWMTSWDTTTADVDRFLAGARAVVGRTTPQAGPTG